jgi:hypothetical protein
MMESPWADLPLDPAGFREAPREYGILPFWFLNGELEPREMRRQLRELRDKGMSGVILHGRYGLEVPYLSDEYLQRIQLALKEGSDLGLQMWIYDEMNWPSGTADGRVLRERPDLAQRYIECITFHVRGPWFTYLTGADSRYLDFEKSTPLAAFAIGERGDVLDLTPNLSFENVIPWEVPEGNWRLMYIVEKRADYYIDAIDPEATETFLRVGYEPYLNGNGSGESPATRPVGFYTDEPAMHYFLSSADNAVVPWTRHMFRRFLERNGYNLRPRLPDLFFDVSPDSARIRYDFYSTLTDFYSNAYYRQIREWCREHGVVFTGHLLYEEWLRKMIRVEGNLFKHFAHLDVIGVDHLYPIIGTQDRPDEHVAMKVASSAAHHLGSPRLLCESFGGIFMDATMQRMKWIADWEYALGVNLLNPHGFHYTLEGPRKRDWPPSMFYQYPWWSYYDQFSEYISRISSVLSGGVHVAKVGVIWPINAMFATYTPQSHSPVGDRTEQDFNVLTDMLLRLHHDFDYVEEDLLASAEIEGGTVRLGGEAYELLILPPMSHLKLTTIEKLETFVQAGGRVLGMIFLPCQAFGPEGLVDVSARMRSLFGVDASQAGLSYQSARDISTHVQNHGAGKAAFFRSYALARSLPSRLQEEVGRVGVPESGYVVIQPEGDTSRYYFSAHGAERQDITDEVAAERREVADAMERLIAELIEPDVTMSNRDVFYLHRVKDGQDVYFFVNPTFRPQSVDVTVGGVVEPFLWDPSSGGTSPIAPWRVEKGRTHFEIALAPTGSAIVVPGAETGLRVIETNITVESIADGTVDGYTDESDAFADIERGGRRERLEVAATVPDPITLDGEWEFEIEDENALVIQEWLAIEETPGSPPEAYAGSAISTEGWVPMGHGAWSYQIPAEPLREYPIDVWYRISFVADQIPPRLSLLIDGFACSSWDLHVNGRPVNSETTPSALDAQIGAVDITDQTRRGENVIALRLTLTGPTDGIIDLVKLTGQFTLDSSRTPAAIVPLSHSLRPASWTEQGYPYYSGRGVYRRRVALPDSYAGQRVFLEASMVDDVLEVVVNGQIAGVRLWPPYSVELTPFLRPGENTLELRVANTLVNLLEATPRPSGLAGAPRLVARAPISLTLSESRDTEGAGASGR